jgi:hypothetical protein
VGVNLLISFEPALAKVVRLATTIPSATEDKHVAAGKGFACVTAFCGVCLYQRGSTCQIRDPSLHGVLSGRSNTQNLKTCTTAPQLTSSGYVADEMHVSGGAALKCRIADPFIS